MIRRCRGHRRRGPAGAASPARRRAGTRPARSGKLRRLPCRSSSTTAPNSKPTTAPQNPESASSTTRSGSASTSGTVRRRQSQSSVRQRRPWTASRIALTPLAPPGETYRHGQHVPLLRMSPAARAATLQARRSARFVAWVRAWRAGLVPCDDAADEIAGDEEHLVADAPGTWTDVSARRTRSPRCPSSTRTRSAWCCPPPATPAACPAPARSPAPRCSPARAVVAGGLGFVPEVRLHTSGSGDEFETVLWRVFVAARPRVPPRSAARRPPRPRRSCPRRWPTRPAPSPSSTSPSGAPSWPARSPRCADPTAPPTCRRASTRGPAACSPGPRAGPGARPGRARRPGGAINGYEVQQRDAALRPLTTRLPPGPGGRLQRADAVGPRRAAGKAVGVTRSGRGACGRSRPGGAAHRG